MTNFLSDLGDAMDKASKNRHRKVRMQIVTMDGDIEHEKEWVVNKNEASYLMYAVGAHRDWIISIVSYMWQQIQQALHTQE